MKHQPRMPKKSRDAAIKQMQEASHAFYLAAVRIGVHPFIEFTGLMNEYITVCLQAEASGKRWEDASAHSGIALPLQDHNAKYLAEKLDCIYGPTLRAHPELRKAVLNG